MNVFELFASLSLKADDFFSGLSAAEKALSNFGGQVMSAINTVKKVDSAIVGISDKVISTTANIVTQTANTVKSLDDTIMGTVDNVVSVVADGFMQMASAGAEFVQGFMQEGMSFDTAMGQVGATLLKTRDDMDATRVSVDGFNGTLREFAKKMGAETMFTATQAGEALNYMALAGYNAQTSAEMMKEVLALAAAGAMDLGTASDMVTDSQTALGIKMEEMTTFIDQMAKTASSSNTSVSQLGDAILSIGATGRQVKGGFTELNTVLGVLADNGIKASESGNMLRRLLTNLTTAEGEAKEQLDKLGVSVFDTQGNMRDLPSIFLELDKAMSGLTDQERAKAISDIFGQYSLAGANALLKTSAERWEELGEKIKDSEGAAQAMADIQLDTLPGQIAILQSAFSGLKTELYEKVAPATKDFVKMLSEGLSDVAKEITSGNFIAAFTRLGGTAAKLIKKGVDTVFKNATTINEFIDGIVIFVDKVGAALFEGGSKLLPQLLGHLLYFSQQIITKFSDFLSKEENIKTIEDTVSHLFEQLETFFDKNHDNLYNIFSTLFDLGIQFIDDLFLLKRETVYSILSEKILEILEELPDKVREWLTSDGLTETVDNVLAFIEDLAQALLDSSAEIVPQLLTFALKLANDVLTSIVDFIGDKENVEKITTIIDQVLSAIDTFLHSHEEQFELIADTVIDIFLKFLPKIMRLKRETTAKLLWHEWERIWEPVGENFGEWLALQKRRLDKWVDKEFKEPFGKIKNFFSTWWDTIVTFWSNKLLGIKSWIDESKELITTAFENFSLADIGKNLIKGLWQGMNDTFLGWLRDKIGGLADNVVGYFEDFFDINSPSKVMEKRVGVFLAKGIGVGFTNEMDKVTEDMQKALPTTFDVNTNIVSKSSLTQSIGGIGSNVVEVHIQNFYNNTQEDVQKFGRALYNEIFRDKVAKA